MSLLLPTSSPTAPSLLCSPSTWDTRTSSEPTPSTCQDRAPGLPGGFLQPQPARLKQLRQNQGRKGHELLRAIPSTIAQGNSQHNFEWWVSAT